MTLSLAEENYLKTIYQLSDNNNKKINTNAIAEALRTKASSVTDMSKKLSEKGLLDRIPYQGMKLTRKGEKLAVQILRKHRIWEVFMVEKLNFTWDEVHEVAEQLEHIQSDKLIDKLDEYLDFPAFDPHGDPIPDKEGNIVFHTDYKMHMLNPGDVGTVAGVKDTSRPFLQYLEKIGLTPGTDIEMLSVEPFDNSINLKLQASDKEVHVSHKTAMNIYVKKVLK